jgi:hypothetical protein
LDETREILYQRQMQKERGENHDDDISTEDLIAGKARTIRFFYLSLISEGFSEQEALLIVSRVPV